MKIGQSTWLSFVFTRNLHHLHLFIYIRSIETREHDKKNPRGLADVLKCRSTTWRVCCSLKLSSASISLQGKDKDIWSTRSALHPSVFSPSFCHTPDETAVLHWLLFIEKIRSSELLLLDLSTPTAIENITRKVRCRTKNSYGVSRKKGRFWNP